MTSPKKREPKPSQFFKI